MAYEDDVWKHRLTSVTTLLIGSPPALPTTPKPKTAITKLTFEDLNIPSRQMTQCLHGCILDTDGQNLRKERIKRRHSEKAIKRQQSDVHQTERNKDSVNNLKAVKCNSFAAQRSHQYITNSFPGCDFDRNTPTRRAKHRRSRTSGKTSSLCDITNGTFHEEEGETVQARLQEDLEYTCLKLPDFIKRIFAW